MLVYTVTDERGREIAKEVSYRAVAKMAQDGDAKRGHIARCANSGASEDLIFDGAAWKTPGQWTASVLTRLGYQ